MTGKPFKHALAWILSNRGLKIEDYIHEYYSVAKFKAAYEARIEPMLGRSQWPEYDLGFKMHPPLLQREARRPRMQRIRGFMEKRAAEKKVRSNRCRYFGPSAKTCKMAEVAEDGERAAPRNKSKKR